MKYIKIEGKVFREIDFDIPERIEELKRQLAIMQEEKDLMEETLK